MRPRAEEVKGCRAVECCRESKCEIWEGMEGGCGVVSTRKATGRGKEGCTLRISPRIRKDMEAQR